MNIKVCKHQFQNIKHEMSFKSILQPNPEQKSSIENIHNKSVLHPTPCLEKQSSKVINNIPQVLLLSWVATSLSCPCLHCLNTEWFALDWSLLDGWAAERQHQKIRGKNQNYSKIVCLQPWCCKSTRETLIPKLHVQKSVSFWSSITAHNTQISVWKRDPAALCPQRSLLSSARHTLKWEQALGCQRENHREPALTHSQHPSRLLEKVCS